MKKLSHANTLENEVLAAAVITVTAVFVGLSSLIWSVAQLLRGHYSQSDYRRIILPKLYSSLSGELSCCLLDRPLIHPYSPLQNALWCPEVDRGRVPGLVSYSSRISTPSMYSP